MVKTLTRVQPIWESMRLPQPSVRCNTSSEIWMKNDESLLRLSDSNVWIEVGLQPMVQEDDVTDKLETGGSPNSKKAHNFSNSLVHIVTPLISAPPSVQIRHFFHH